MKKTILAFLFLAAGASLNAQSNFQITNSLIQPVLLGNYNPASYKATNVINRHDSIAKGINKRISADSLRKDLEILAGFTNRNTGSDTVSSVKGIGAARRWVHTKFKQYSAANENRLLVGYFQFDLAICNQPQHRNIMAVLPGSDTTEKSILIVEAHIDSRCAVLCDTACLAQGMEDNGSGTALVMEMARVMSKYTFKNTIVFMPVIGEEQGLYGADAFAKYCVQKGIKIKGVMNNDVIGGILCGKTSSAPSCPYEGHIDSTQVRIFSLGTFNSFHKGFARFVKLEYKEELLPYVKVPMKISIMTPEDRTGRGGDHQPFRMQGFTAIRFTSANEHGDASNGTGYVDRQHTSKDILGKDTNNDGQIDSFYVDFNYLARNAAINANGIGMAAIGPKTPDGVFTAVFTGGYSIRAQVTTQTQYLHYRIGLRTTTNDFDTVFTLQGALIDTFTVSPASIYYLSVASVDSFGVESLFSKEYLLTQVGVTEIVPEKPIELLQNKPNPFDLATTISVLVNGSFTYKDAYILITDIQGKEVQRTKVELKSGMNEVLYEHGYQVSGTYVYSLIVDGKTLQSRRMVFTN